HGQLHPVAHGRVPHGGGAVDVARLHLALEQRVAVSCHHAHCAGLGYLEGLVVRAVLFGLLRHEAHVGHRAHGARVVGAVDLAVVDDRLVHAGVRAVGDDELGVVRLAVRAPHLAGVADGGGHGGVHDHV